MFKLLLVIFCFFSATGSFPVDVAGLKLSNIFTLAFCAVMPLFLTRHKLDSALFAPLAAVAALFIFWQTCSALWANEVAFSAYRALVVDGYVFLSIALPIAATNRSIDMVGLYGRVTVLASLLLLASYVVFQPFGARAVYPQLFIPSMRLEPLEDFDLNDPNIVACALSVGFICCMDKIRHPLARTLAAVICFSAIVVTQSRTAILFLPVAAFAAAVLTGRLRTAVVALFATSALLLAVVAAFQWLSSIGGDSVVVAVIEDRLFSDSASNEDRLERLQGAIAALEQPFIAVFGLGAGGSISSGLEPHNMFLSFFLELGIFGFVMFCVIFGLIMQMAYQTPDRSRRFYAIWLLLFIFFACLTYWHTRTLWFSLSLIVSSLLSRRQIDRVRHIESGTAPAAPPLVGSALQHP